MVIFALRSGGAISPSKVKFGLLQIGRLRNGFQDPNQRTVWDVEGLIVLKGKASFGRGSRIDVGKNGKLVLGEDFNTSGDVTIVCQDRISFGNNCLLAWDILIMDSDFHYINYRGTHNDLLTQPIYFGNHIWICYGVNILKGVYIGDNNVIAANSLVTKSIRQKNCLIIGNLIKKNNVSWRF